MIHGRIVSEDGTATLIVARPGEEGFSDSLYEDIRALVGDFEGPEEVYVAGRPIVEGALAELGPADMARLQDELETDEAVGDSFALTDFIKRMHQVMHEEDPDYYAVPDSRELVAQYLLLYEMSADPDSLEQVIDYEYTSANLTVQVKDDSSQTLSRIIEMSDAYRDEFASLGVSVDYAGSGYRALVFSELILDGQIKSLAISLVIVVVLLGIDYAIHMIERYKEYLGERGTKHEAAILTMHHSGRAIMYNAFVVASGFAVLLDSVSPPNRQVGGLVALNMAVSFLGTVTVLFLLLYRGSAFGQDKRASTLTNNEEEEAYA
ncbi:MAG: MMPL family transporter [Spirochaetota bacterium]